jgi:hypothetical protein
MEGVTKVLPRYIVNIYIEKESEREREKLCQTAEGANIECIAYRKR